MPRSGVGIGVSRRRAGGGGGGPGPSPDLLPLTSRIAFGGNSYEAQTGNIDIVQYAWLAAGCRGWPSLGMRQARGGDRLTHLHDRAAPLTAVRAGVYVVMTPENDFSDAAVTNNSAGGDAVVGRLNTVITDIRNAGGGQIIIQNSPDTNGYESKPLAGARYNATLPTGSDLTTFDIRATFDPNNGAQSGDGVHPNKRASAKAIGDALGPVIASKFVSAGIFDAGDDLAGNLVTWNPATAWTVTTNSSGLSVSQSQNGTARRFEITGTCASDEAGAGTTADVRLRLSMTYKTPRSTWATALGSLFRLKVTNAADGAPTALATLNASNGTGNAFNKQYTASHGAYWTERFEGPFGIIPTLLQGTSNASAVTFDIIVRGVNGQAVDVVIEVSAVNHLSTEDTAYGPATNASAAFTIGDGTNRPVLFSIPTTNPAAGGSIALGATLSPLNCGTIIGGGLTNTIDAIRNGSQDVGDATPVTQSSAAVPYTVASPCVAADTIQLRRNASNSFGGGSSASVMSGTLTVTA